MAETGVRAQGWRSWLKNKVYAYHLISIKVSLSNTPGGGTLGELSNFAVPQSPVIMVWTFPGTL